MLFSYKKYKKQYSSILALCKHSYIKIFSKFFKFNKMYHTILKSFFFFFPLTTVKFLSYNMFLSNFFFLIPKIVFKNLLEFLIEKQVFNFHFFFFNKFFKTLKIKAFRQKPIIFIYNKLYLCVKLLNTLQIQLTKQHKKLNFN